LATVGSQTFAAIDAVSDTDNKHNVRSLVTKVTNHKTSLTIGAIIVGTTGLGGIWYWQRGISFFSSKKRANDTDNGIENNHTDKKANGSSMDSDTDEMENGDEEHEVNDFGTSEIYNSRETSKPSAALQKVGENMRYNKKNKRLVGRGVANKGKLQKQNKVQLQTKPVNVGQDKFDQEKTAALNEYLKQHKNLTFHPMEFEVVHVDGDGEGLTIDIIWSQIINTVNLTQLKEGLNNWCKLCYNVRPTIRIFEAKVEGVKGCWTPSSKGKKIFNPNMYLLENIEFFTNQRQSVEL
jgi:hypothetical protein